MFFANDKKIQCGMPQEAPDVPRENKILKPSDYPSDVDHPKGEWNTMIRKSKSLVLAI